MPYATQQTIVDRYGLDALLLVADRDNDGQVDAAVLDRALTDASNEIDVYVASKYPLPLASVPPVLGPLCADIVMYKLAAEAGAGLTEEKRKRYEDAVKLLKAIASGEVSLGIPTPPPSSNGAVVIGGPGRIFTRDSMRGVR